MTFHASTTGRAPRIAFTMAAVVSAALALGGCTGATGTAPTTDPTAKIVRPAAPEGALPADLQAELRGALEEAMAEFDVTGAVAGVWVPGAGSWTSAAGIADIASGAPATTEMQWPLRSVTKSYTVTLLLQLVDEGVMSLDDTIGQYVDGVTDGDAITLRQLANMTSGNADYVNAAFLEAFQPDPDRLFTLDELNAFMLGLPAEFTPGTRKVYVNANTNLLGAAIESATGEDFADVLDERILAPLGQTGTRYLLDVSAWTAPHATGYRLLDDVQTPQPANLSIYGPAGSMISTLDDARVWGEALATGMLLDPATQAERLQGEPLEEGPPYDLYALGIGETDGWWGHNGQGFGFTAAVFHNPETGASIAVFMNAADLASREHPADRLFRRFAEILENVAGA
jgi:D-alanyl-D-alanine carboxypeptidase